MALPGAHNDVLEHIDVRSYPCGLVACGPEEALTGHASAPLRDR
jgi:hypothetical protein